MRAGRSALRLSAIAVALTCVALAAPLPAQAAAQQSPARTTKAAPKSAPPAATPPAAAPAAPVPDQSAQPDKEDGGKAEGGGLPLPRFVSLRTDPINLRTGPGMRYPVDWVYRRRHLPVEVISEFDTWRKIRDPDGAEGWVHQSMLTGHRTAMVKGELRRLRRNSADDSDKIASLEPGVIVNVQRCPSGPFCRVEVDGLQGWVRRDEIWGVYPDEAVE